MGVEENVRGTFEPAKSRFAGNEIDQRSLMFYQTVLQNALYGEHVKTVAREHVIIQWHLLAVATIVKLMNNPLAVATNVKRNKMRLARRNDDCDEHIY